MLCAQDVLNAVRAATRSEAVTRADLRFSLHDVARVVFGASPGRHAIVALLRRLTRRIGMMAAPAEVFSQALKLPRCGPRPLRTAARLTSSRLWAHETIRVLGDRLAAEGHVEMLGTAVADAAGRRLSTRPDVRRVPRWCSHANAPPMQVLFPKLATAGHTSARERLAGISFSAIRTMR